MSKKLQFLVLLLCFALLSTACSGADEAPKTDDIPAAVEVEESDTTEAEGSDGEEEVEVEQENTEEVDEPSPIDAAGLFTSNCSGCHGQDRSGGRGPALLPDRLTGEAGQYAKIISEGQGGMPAFSGKLSAEEINAIAEWILTAPE
jgi:mono/diheme cytochrome c family protein